MCWINAGFYNLRFEWPADLYKVSNFRPAYLRDMLRILTGQNTQQHIHYALIEKAKVCG